MKHGEESTRIGIVVPTLGTRPSYLAQSLRSIREAGGAFIVVVAPATADLSAVEREDLFDLRIVDPRTGLASAIDVGLNSLPPEIEYINWLGDDDLLTPQSLTISSSVLERDASLSYVYGACEYIDAEGQILWRNSSGRWAPWLMRFGPDLIPQPGALIRRMSFKQVGGLSTRLGWAFDLDLFLRLEAVGKSKYLPVTLGKFRWHDGSLSVGSRGGSISEARQVRNENLNAVARRVSFLWEVPFGLVGQIFARRLSRKATG